MKIAKLLALKSSVVLLVLAISAIAYAEVSSRSCPYSCQTEGIAKRNCKDWKQGNTCFIDDLRKKKPKKQKQPPVQANLKREIVLVNKDILAGQRIELSFPNNEPVDHLDAVVRRKGGSSNTALSASIGNAIALGSKQVDRNDNHVVRFMANGTRAEGRKLVLSANSGDVFVESVHLLTR